MKIFRLEVTSHMKMLYSHTYSLLMDRIELRGRTGMQFGVCGLRVEHFRFDFSEGEVEVALDA